MRSPELAQSGLMKETRTAWLLVRGDRAALRLDRAADFSEPLIADPGVGQGNRVDQLRLEGFDRQYAFEELECMIEAIAEEMKAITAIQGERRPEFSSQPRADWSK